MWAEILFIVLYFGLNVQLAVHCLRLPAKADFCNQIKELFGYQTDGKREAIIAAVIMIPFGSILSVLVLVLSIAFFAALGLYYVVFVKCLKGVCRLFNEEQFSSLIQIAVADLKRDSRAMKREGRNFWLIKTVIIWRGITTFVPIAWDCLVRIMKAILPFAKIFKG